MYFSIKENRLQCRLTQQEVADGVGVSERTYQRWESGESMPSLDDLSNLARLFDISFFSILPYDFHFQVGDDISIFLDTTFYKQMIPDVSERNYYLFWTTLAGNKLEVNGITRFVNFTRTILPLDDNDTEEPILMEKRVLRDINPSNQISLFFGVYKKLPLIIDSTMSDSEFVDRYAEIRYHGGYVIIEDFLCEKFFPEYIEYEVPSNTDNGANISKKYLELK